MHSRCGLHFLPKLDSIGAFKQDMKGGFYFLLIKVALRVDIHPNTVEVGISRESVKSEKPEEGFNFVGSISLPDGLELTACVLGIC